MTDKFTYICDRCDKLTSNPLVLYIGGMPLIVCQECYARERIKVKAENLPRYRNIPKSTTVRKKNNRYVVAMPIERTNSRVVKLTFYEDNEKKGYLIAYTQDQIKQMRNDFLEDGIIKDRGEKQGKMSTNKSGQLNKDTKAYKNKVKYINKWVKENNQRLVFYLNKEKDAELVEWVKSAPNKAALIRECYELYKKAHDL